MVVNGYQWLLMLLMMMMMMSFRNRSSRRRNSSHSPSSPARRCNNATPGRPNFGCILAIPGGSWGWHGRGPMFSDWKYRMEGQKMMTYWYADGFPHGFPNLFCSAHGVSWVFGSFLVASSGPLRSGIEGAEELLLQDAILLDILSGKLT